MIIRECRVLDCKIGPATRELGEESGDESV